MIKASWFTAIHVNKALPNVLDSLNTGRLIKYRERVEEVHIECTIRGSEIARRSIGH